MTIISKLLAASALTASIAVCSPAMAVTPTITGTLNFQSPGGSNFFDGTQFNQFTIPSTYENYMVAPTIAVGSGIEFGYVAGFFASPHTETDTADFTDTSLTIQDVIGSSTGTSNFYMTFTSNIAGFFDNAVLTDNSFTGATFNVSANGETLSFTTLATNKVNTTEAATFTFGAAVPEPATWGIMILGFAGVGAAVRRRNKLQVA
jgi:hypothetical protein